MNTKRMMEIFEIIQNYVGKVEVLEKERELLFKNLKSEAEFKELDNIFSNFNSVDRSLSVLMNVLAHKNFKKYTDYVEKFSVNLARYEEIKKLKEQLEYLGWTFEEK